MFNSPNVASEWLFWIAVVIWIANIISFVVLRRMYRVNRRYNRELIEEARKFRDQQRDFMQAAAKYKAVSDQFAKHFGKPL